MITRSLLLAVLLLTVLAPLPALATSCREWNRMPEARKWSRVDRMISDAIAGQRGRNYNINRDALSRCLSSHAEDMFWDFEDLCADSRTAGMGAIRSRFKGYIWTCVN